MAPLNRSVPLILQKRRNKVAALKLLRRLLKNQGIHPEVIVTDGLAPYPAAMRILGCKDPAGLKLRSMLKSDMPLAWADQPAWLEAIASA